MKYYSELDDAYNKIVAAKRSLSDAEKEKDLLKLKETKLQHQCNGEQSNKDYLQKYLTKLSEGVLSEQVLLEKRSAEKRVHDSMLEQRESDLSSDKNQIKYLEEKSDQSYILMQQLENSRNFHAKVTSYASMPFENSSGLNGNIISQEESDIIGQILADSDYQ